MNDFLNMIKKEVKERLENKIGTVCYPCDMGFALTENENANGSWYCSEYKAKEDLKNYFDDFLDFQSYYYTTFGEPIWFGSDDYRHSVDCVHCSMMICAIENVFNQAFSKMENSDTTDDLWNSKIEFTQELVDKIIKSLKEVYSVW